MNNITLLYYTSNVMLDYCAQNVRKYLLELVGDKYPIISVSQKPLDLGQNICVGEIGKSYYNCYKQIYIGAQEVKTKYIACVEDDTLYNLEHFEYRPSKGTFSFNENMWYLEEKCFWHKYERGGMCTCIVERDVLVETLAPRFIMYPYESDVSERGQRYFQEPGRNDKRFGIPNAKVEYFKTEVPIITFNYFAGLGGKKVAEAHAPVEQKTLDPWGDSKTLKRRFWNEK